MELNIEKYRISKLEFNSNNIPAEQSSIEVSISAQFSLRDKQDQKEAKIDISADFVVADTDKKVLSINLSTICALSDCSGQTDEQVNDFISRKTQEKVYPILKDKVNEFYRFGNFKFIELPDINPTNKNI